MVRTNFETHQITNSSLSYPYYYVCCTPESENKTRCKSRIIFKNLNPVWNENFEFEVVNHQDGDTLNDESLIFQSILN